MSQYITPAFQEALANLFTQKSTTTQLYLKPLNTVVLLDSNGNTIATTNSIVVTYQSGVINIKADFQASSDSTVATVLVGNTYSGVFTAYFTVPNLNFSVSQGNYYEIKITIVLNNVSLTVSPFKSATVYANKLFDVIGNILAGNPLHTGKTGQFFDAIYIVNTSGNVSQSYRIPITIATISPLLTIGGIIAKTVYGNQIVLRDSNQNDLVIVQSNTPITFKSGRPIIFEFIFG